MQIFQFKSLGKEKKNVYTYVPWCFLMIERNEKTVGSFLSASFQAEILSVFATERLRIIHNNQYFISFSSTDSILDDKNVKEKYFKYWLSFGRLKTFIQNNFDMYSDNCPKVSQGSQKVCLLQIVKFVFVWGPRKQTPNHQITW